MFWCAEHRLITTLTLTAIQLTFLRALLQQSILSRSLGVSYVLYLCFIYLYECTTRAASVHPRSLSEGGIRAV